MSYLDQMNETARKKLFRLSAQQEKQVLQAYKDAGNSLVRKYKNSKAGSATKAYYNSYIKSLTQSMEQIIMKNGYAGAQIPAYMAQEITKQSFLDGGIKGLEFNKVFGRVPYTAMANIIEGDIYKLANGGYIGLSERIWNVANTAGADIQRVVLAGMAQQTSAIDLARALEAYVDPKVRKTWDKAKIEKHLGKGYASWNKNVEYNALRLARTTLTHSFQLSLIQSCKQNPYLDKLKWHSVLQHGRTCDLCRERHGNLYKLDKVPLDHPNGLCWQEAVASKSMDEIGEELAQWVNGSSVPHLDSWHKARGYQFATNKVAQYAINANFTVKPVKYAKKNADDYRVVEFKGVDGQLVTGTVHKDHIEVIEEYAKYYSVEEKQDVIYELMDMLVMNPNKQEVKDIKTAIKFLEKVQNKTISITPKSIARAQLDLTDPKVRESYRRIDSMFDAMDWGEDHYDTKWLSSLPVEDKDAVITYTGSSYIRMNKYLRLGDNSISDTLKAKIPKATRALEKAEVPENIVAFRGCSKSALKGHDLDNLKGAIIEDKGFMSTSILTDRAKNFEKDVLYEIYVPKGYKGAGYVGNISNHGHECELLFKPNAKLRVLEVKDTRHKIHLIMEAVI